MGAALTIGATRPIGTSLTVGPERGTGAELGPGGRTQPHDVGVGPTGETVPGKAGAVVTASLGVRSGVSLEQSALTSPCHPGTQRRDGCNAT